VACKKSDSYASDDSIRCNKRGKQDYSENDILDDLFRQDAQNLRRLTNIAD